MDHVLLPPSDQTFTRYQDLIKLHTGIYLPPHKKTLLHSRLSKRLFASAMASYDDYFELLVSSAGKNELKAALELVTTNETYFFREPAHFDFMKDLLDCQPRTGERYRVWSAASSSGEEAYSLAMVLQSHCSKPWELLASDINQTVITDAKKGIYLNQRTSMIPQEFLNKYCRKGVGEFEGYLRVAPELRNRVQFDTLNLMGQLKGLGKFDIIFIRNVMIYFDDETRGSILRKLSKHLKPSGWLFVSHSESLHGVSDDYYSIKPSIYRLAAFRDEHKI